MSSQYLFTYGTLKSDQPEHSRHCSPPRSIQSARVRGSLWRLREGYPILQIDPAQALLDATKDLPSDWQCASELAARQSPVETKGRWIEGELFEYSLHSEFLQKMDAWENFVPGIKSAYQRRAIWVEDEDRRPQVAWAYVCYAPPNGAVELDASSWPD